jgi:enoyl-CoA hydratase
MTLDFRKEDGIAWIGLNRPEAKNAMNAAMLRALSEAWDEVAADDAIRAAVVYSAVPDIFCAGLDLRSVIPIFTRMKEPVTDDERWLAEAGPALFRATLRERDWVKPVVAAVHGLCLTAGFEMVMGADLRVASEDARFQMREAFLGFMPTGGSTVFLPREIPLAAAKEILCLADEVPARRLHEWGFLNRLVPRERLIDEAGAIARRVADNGPLAVQGILRTIRETLHLDLPSAMAKELEIGLPIFGSEDAREGVRAQREKRKADFKGRM